VLILKGLERLEDGAARNENFQEEGRWTQRGWKAEKLPGGTGSSRLDAGHADREEGKRFEAAK